MCDSQNVRQELSVSVKSLLVDLFSIEVPRVRSVNYEDRYMSMSHHSYVHSWSFSIEGLFSPLSVFFQMLSFSSSDVPRLGHHDDRLAMREDIEELV